MVGYSTPPQLTGFPKQRMSRKDICIIGNVGLVTMKTLMENNALNSKLWDQTTHITILVLKNKTRATKSQFFLFYYL